MKQTKNALSMLLNAYRSVYKSAYFKGLASVVVLTAGLPAGAANAATTIDLADSLDTLSNGIIVSDQGSSSSVTDGAQKWANGGLTVQAGADYTVSGQGTLHIANGDLILQNGSTLTVSGSAGAAAMQIVGADNALGGDKGEGSVENNLIANNATIKLIGENASLGFAAVSINGGTIELSGKNANIWAYGEGGYTADAADDGDYSAADMSIIGATVNINISGASLGARDGIEIENSTINVT